MEEEIRGIDYHVHPKPDPHMFIGNGYVRERLVGGRSRKPELVRVRYDRQYPADLVNDILMQVSSICESTEDYENWFTEFIITPTHDLNRDSCRLDGIKAIIAKYKAESSSNPRWDKANKLITELDSILGDSNVSLYEVKNAN
jgi:hypothetical protein